MADKILTKWLKVGYPYLKAESGLPGWVLPQRSFNRVADEVGDDDLLHLARVLRLVGGERDFYEKASSRAELSTEDWRNAVKNWVPLPQFKPVVEAFLEAAGVVIAHFSRIRSRFSPRLIARALAVLLFAPFVSQAKALINGLADILGSEAAKPAEMIKSYAQAVVTDDIETLERIDQCIVRWSHWSEWADAVEEQVSKSQYVPKLMAITPRLSMDLASVLALMMKDDHDESRGHR